MIVPIKDKTNRLDIEDIVLTEEQDEAMSLMLNFVEDEQRLEFRLGGYAGVGKTVVIAKLLSKLEKLSYQVAVASFTGKAVSVLQSKGVSGAQTLHSLMYTYEMNEKGRMVFEKVWRLGFDIVIVDEASMVSQDLYDTLSGFGVKVIYVGDPAQLEPVGANPNLMRKCDFVLKEISRQAAESPIIRISQAIRTGKLCELPIGRWGSEKHGFVTVTKSQKDLDYLDADIILCAKNDTRHRLNAHKRSLLNREGQVSEGDSVICLRNNKKQAMFNGLITTVTKIRGGGSIVDANLVDDLGKCYPEIAMLTDYFGKDIPREAQLPRDSAPHDFAYALTFHKSQGSEFDNVIAFDQPLYGANRQRLRYTYITRAAKYLTILVAA